MSRIVHKCNGVVVSQYSRSAFPIFSFEDNKEFERIKKRKHREKQTAYKAITALQDSPCTAITITSAGITDIYQFKDLVGKFIRTFRKQKYLLCYDRHKNKHWHVHCIVDCPVNHSQMIKRWEDIAGGGDVYIDDNAELTPTAMYITKTKNLLPEDKGLHLRTLHNIKVTRQTEQHDNGDITVSWVEGGTDETG